MISFLSTLDDRSMSALDRLMTMASWEEMMLRGVSQKLGQEALDYIKNTPKMLVVRSQSTGQLANSLRFEQTSSGDGFEVNFYGLQYGNWVDVGNFDPEQELWAPRGAVQQAFPIDSRFSAGIFSPYIHGMGHLNPDSPTHFSDKTVDWLSQGKALEVAATMLGQFLETVVGV